jgi:transposase
MANLRKPMFQIRRLLELKVQGKSKRKIAKVLGISRNTVQNYLNSFESHFVDLSSCSPGVMKPLTALFVCPRHQLLPLM